MINIIMIFLIAIINLNADKITDDGKTAFVDHSKDL